MVYFAVRCDTVPGKQEEFDRLVAEKAKTFWLSQPGVESFQVYGDSLFGWPERTIMIGVKDWATLQKILDSRERHRLRSELMSCVSRSESQILHNIL